VALTIFIAHPSALLTDHRPHGDGLVAHGFIQRLAERGHELHVAAAQVSLQRELPSNVHLHLLGAGGPPGRLARLRYMGGLRRLFGALQRTTKFDLIHQLNPVDAGLTLALPSVDQPVILGPYIPAWPAWSESDGAALATRVGEFASRAVRAAQQRRATTVLLSTPAAASRLQAPFAKRVVVRELSPGIDERTWSPANDGLHRQDILFLASLERRKGILVLLDAFERLALDLPEARLLVAGAGALAPEVGAIVAGSAGLERVELLGPVERALAPELMRACTVHCLPSLGEPFGMTALEAMACAKPIVATDAGGLKHLVPDGGGLRVPPGDATGLTAALRQVLTSPALQQRMGDYNRALIERRYTWTRVIDRLEQAYEEAIGLARVR
jgi:L-malate glycosyltransferase